MVELLMSGGPVMIPIGVASVIGLAVFLERVLALRGGAVIPSGLVIEVDELLRQDRFGDVIAAARKSDSAAARVTLVAINAKSMSRSEIKERLEEVGRREAAALERFAVVLGTVASIAPL